MQTAIAATASARWTLILFIFGFLTLPCPLQYRELCSQEVDLEGRCSGRGLLLNPQRGVLGLPFPKGPLHQGNKSRLISLGTGLLLTLTDAIYCCITSKH